MTTAAVFGWLPTGAAEAGGADDAGKKTVLEIVPAPDGILNVWLLSPLCEGNNFAVLAKKPPAGEREGAPFPAGAEKPVGRWYLHAEPTGYVNPSPRKRLRPGVVWALGKFHAADNGRPGARRRRLTARAYDGPLRVFVNGKKVLELKEPTFYEPTTRSVMVEFPPGECEVAVAAGTRWGYARFLSAVTAADGRATAGDLLRLPVKRETAAAVGDLCARLLTFSLRKDRLKIRAGLEKDTARGDPPFVEPNEQVLLRFGLRGARPKGLESFSLRLVREAAAAAAGEADGGGGDGDGDGEKGGGLFPEKEIAVLPARRISRLYREHWEASYIAPAAVPAETFLRVEVRAPTGRRLGCRRVRLWACSGFKQAEVALRRQVKAIRRRTGRKLPGTTLALDKLACWLEKLKIGKRQYSDASFNGDDYGEALTQQAGETMSELLRQARRRLPVEAAGGDPWRGRLGYFERAYWSSIDDSAQPYLLLVPRVFGEVLRARRKKAAKKTTTAAAAGAGAGGGAGGAGPTAKPRTKRWPLIVFLHGYVPRYDIHRWWDEIPEFNALCDRKDTFLLIPFGRSNTDFVGCGEEDVLSAVEDVRRHYPIDPNRVYLFGYSMGGMAVFTLGGHWPDRWAAAVSFAARADSPLLMGVPGGEAAVPPFKRRLMRADSPVHLVENFLNLPVRLYHGRDDMIVPPADAVRLKNRLKKVGADAALSWWTGGHNTGFSLLGRPAPVEWLLSQRRNGKPKRRRLKEYSLRYGTRGGVSVLHLREADGPYELEWRETTAEGNAALELLKVSGPVAVASLVVPGRGERLRLPPNRGRLSLLPAEKEHPFLRFLWDAAWCRSGFPAGGGTVPNRTGTKKNNGVRKPPGPRDFFPPGFRAWKNQLRCGPVKEATYSAFTLVYGTGGDATATKKLRRQAEEFAERWRRFAKGRPPLKADTEVTAEDLRRRNLFLFGDARENRLHARAAPALPFKVENGTAVVAGKKVALKNRGLMYIYPNPLPGAGPFRSVVIVVGTPYGEYLPRNHQLDLIPDFLIYEKERDSDGTNTNRPVVAGYFDGRWRTTPKTTWWFETGGDEKR